MKLEVLVSTMKQSECISLVEKMNIKTKCIIVNQLGFAEKISEKTKVINSEEKGLSKSRNECIRNSNADICLIADDDVIYVDDYEKIIVRAHKKFKDADIIAFEVPSTNLDRPSSVINKNKRLDFIGSMKLSSFQISFKLDSIKKNNLEFDEKFGAGSQYKMGEENIFLFDCLKKGLKIYFVKEKIANVSHDESTWFDGYNSRYFRDLGAIYTRMSSKIGKLLLLQFLVRKFNLYSNEISILEAWKAGSEGCKKFKSKSRGNKNV